MKTKEGFDNIELYQIPLCKSKYVDQILSTYTLRSYSLV